MKETRQFVLTQEEVFNMLKDFLPFPIPKDAKIYSHAEREWYEWNSYNRSSTNCVMIEFSSEDLEKEVKKEQEALEKGGEQDWSIV